MDSDFDTSDDFSLECFRIVRHCQSPSKEVQPDDSDQEVADAVYVPTRTMATLSLDPPSSPMFDDAQDQAQIRKVPMLYTRPWPWRGRRRTLLLGLNLVLPGGSQPQSRASSTNADSLVQAIQHTHSSFE